MILGLDMGGTHIDAVLFHKGEIINLVKNPTDHSNLLESLRGTFRCLLKGQDTSRIKRIILSTTVSTNAIIENKTDNVGMIMECGPGLERDFLKCGLENVFVSGYIDHRGREISEILPKEITNAQKIFKNAGITAVAVAGKFSVRNAKHENEIHKILNDRFFPVTLGHSLSGKLNFPRRVFTSFYNSAVYSTFKKFSENINKVLMEEGIFAPIYVLKADGGTMGLKVGERYPVGTILSGPAASVMGGQAFIKTSKDAIFLDIGGTTTDISFLADGVPLFEPLGIKIGVYPTLIRALYNVSIGVGGDSKIEIKDGNLIIGPERHGQPIATGGIYPTPTDAMIALGLIHCGSKDRALKAMKDLGQFICLGIGDTARMILEKMASMIKDKVEKLLYEVNSHPVYTVKELLYGKKIEPEFLQVIGGPAKALAPFLSKKFNMPCKYPEMYTAANAVGAALARTTAEITMFVDTVQKHLTVSEMGIHEKINHLFSLEEAESRALNLVKQQAVILGAEEEQAYGEIIEANSFNMVRGFATRGKNMRVRAQTKPGLTYRFGGEGKC